MAEKSHEVYALLAKDHPTVDEFKILLEHVAPGVLAKRYLSSGLPFVFKDQPHKYLSFREAAGKICGVPPQQVAVMGSARFGFSTSPNKQGKEAPKALDDNSDMDLVVISAKLFQASLASFAIHCFKVLCQNKDLTSALKSDDETVTVVKKELQIMRSRSKALYFGYVSPNDLEDGSPEKQRYYDMQREAATQLFGTAPPGPINRIGARIYKDWDSAERAFEFSFKRLSNVLGIAAKDSYSAISLAEDPDDGNTE
jgi:hypothetical protein